MNSSSNVGDWFGVAEQISIMMGYPKGEKTSELAEIISRLLLPNKTNPSDSDRSRFLRHGESIKLSTKLQSPLFNTSKCLPTNMKIRISLSKNNDGFVIISDGEKRTTYTLKIAIYM